MPLITPIIDIAIVVVVLGLVEGGYLGVVEADGTNMVSDDIYHHPDIHVMGSLNESLKTVCTTKVVVNLVPVLSPVTVETILSVINNW